MVDFDFDGLAGLQATRTVSASGGVNGKRSRKVVHFGLSTVKY